MEFKCGQWRAFDGLMTDLSKAFYCLNDKILIPKHDTYGFGLTSMKLIQQYV